jgi:hypothetical protein
MTVLKNSCNEKDACQGASGKSDSRRWNLSTYKSKNTLTGLLTFTIPTGKDILIENGCTGSGACQYLIADYVRVYGGCNADYSCRKQKHLFYEPIGG